MVSAFEKEGKEGKQAISNPADLRLDAAVKFTLLGVACFP